MARFCRNCGNPLGENVNKNLGVSNVNYGIGASAAGSAMGGRSDTE